MAKGPVRMPPSSVLRSSAMLLMLVSPAFASERHGSDSYRQLKAAVTYAGVTLGDSTVFAHSMRSGFVPGEAHALSRLMMGADCGLMIRLLTDWPHHTVSGLDFTTHCFSPGANAAITSIKARIEAVYGITLMRNGLPITKDGVSPVWRNPPDGPTNYELLVSITSGAPGPQPAAPPGK